MSNYNQEYRENEFENRETQYYYYVRAYKGKFIDDLITYEGRNKIVNKAITRYEVIDSNNNYLYYLSLLIEGLRFIEQQ